MNSGPDRTLPPDALGDPQLQLRLQLRLLELKLATAEDEAHRLRSENRVLGSQLAAAATMSRRLATLGRQHTELERAAADRGADLWETVRSLETSRLGVAELQQERDARDLELLELRVRLDAAEAVMADLRSESQMLFERVAEARRARDIALAEWGKVEVLLSRLREMLEASG